MIQDPYEHVTAVFSNGFYDDGLRIPKTNINTATLFKITANGHPIAGDTHWDAATLTATFTPTEPYPVNVKIKVKLEKSAVRNIHGKLHRKQCTTSTSFRVTVLPVLLKVYSAVCSVSATAHHQLQPTTPPTPPTTQHTWYDCQRCTPQGQVFE